MVAKHECIPVGCVPTVAVAISGGSASYSRPPFDQTPNTPCPSDQTYQTPTPSDQTPPWPLMHSGKRQTPSCGQNEWHTPVKTVPSPILHMRSVKRKYYIVFTRPLQSSSFCSHKVTDVNKMLKSNRHGFAEITLQIWKPHELKYDSVIYFLKCLKGGCGVFFSSNESPWKSVRDLTGDGVMWSSCSESAKPPFWSTLYEILKSYKSWWIFCLSSTFSLLHTTKKTDQLQMRR